LGYEIQASVVNFLACVVFLAVLPFEATKHWPRPFIIWFLFLLLFVVPLGFVFMGLKPKASPAPHFTFSLQLGDSPDSTVFLTNDFLFSRKIVKVGDLPNGAIKFNAFVNGCLVIPLQTGETNIIFHFVAENDSAMKVSDFEAAVGFPKDWQCGFDAKWHKVDESLIIPGAWKFEATNMQFVAAQSSWVLFPYDTLDFPPITNSCKPEYIGSTTKGGLVELSFRSTGFENVLAANIIFLPALTNFFKPFVTLGEIGTDGLLRLTITQEEFEQSQK
jgi:hypothetical protein